MEADTTNAQIISDSTNADNIPANATPQSNSVAGSTITAPMHSGGIPIVSKNPNSAAINSESVTPSGRSSTASFDSFASSFGTTTNNLLSKSLNSLNVIEVRNCLHTESKANSLKMHYLYWNRGLTCLDKLTDWVSPYNLTLTKNWDEKKQTAKWLPHFFNF